MKSVIWSLAIQVNEHVLTSSEFDHSYPSNAQIRVIFRFVSINILIKQAEELDSGNNYDSKHQMSHHFGGAFYPNITPSIIIFKV